MTVGHVLIVLAVGSCIGYVTNYIAVKMLFRPYNPVKIGNWTLPLTPGVIPKNKSRLAKACGRAIEGNLFSSEDIKNSFDFEKLADTIADNLDLNMPISSFASEESFDKLGEDLADKVVDRIKAMDIRSFIVEKGGKALEERVAGTMIGMFVNASMIESFADPICAQVYDYLDNEGKVKIQDMISDELDKIGKKSVKEELDAFGVEYKSIIKNMIVDFADKNIDRLMPEINVSAIVEDKINEMDVKDFEKLVLSVMKKELQAIVNLGALIGLVIGLINLVVL